MKEIIARLRSRRMPPMLLVGSLLLTILLSLGWAFSRNQAPPAVTRTPLPQSTETKPLPTLAMTTPLPAPVVKGASSPEASPTAESNFTDTVAYVPVVMNAFATVACNQHRPGRAGEAMIADNSAGLRMEGSVSGQLVKWHPITISFAGPVASEGDEHPNPFLDYRLQVALLGPSGQLHDVPGFFAGDGKGNGIGNVWQVRFAPDEAGRWQYCASFRAGPRVAVDLDQHAGVPIAFDGASGVFEVAGLDVNAPGFLKWGRLQYVGEHYMKFVDGPYWIKSGTDSPENFLGYRGFDNTLDQGGIISDFVHAYAPHAADWQPGDPYFINRATGVDSKGIIGALNYLSQQHVNSLYFLPMNLGGDGQETYPFISPGGTPFDNTHYDVSKLHQWNIVLNHAQQKGIAFHFVLNETEVDNRMWLDGGKLDVERKLFYREMIARFGYLLALKWNLSEEVVFTSDEIVQFADYIRALDWANHSVTIHNPAGWFLPFEELLGDRRFTSTAFQYSGEGAGEIVEAWRKASMDSNFPWVIDMDENNPAGIGLTHDNADQLRKQILYDVYFSGGNIEWYMGYHELPTGGDVNLEDFRTREAMWNYMWYARHFMQQYLPFWRMRPADELLIGESDAYGGGEVFALDSVVYAVYLPAADPAGTLELDDIGNDYWLRWYNPRTGEFESNALNVAVAADGLPLGVPPRDPAADWVVLVTSTAGPVTTPAPAPYP